MYSIAVILLLGFFTGQQICYGYKAVAYKDGVYAAVGESDNLVFFSSDAQVTKSVPLREGIVLNDIEYFSDVLVSAGNNVFLLYDGQSVYYSDVSGEVTALSVFKDCLYVAVNTPNGAQLLSFSSPQDYPRVEALSLKGSIVSLSSSEYDCYGITDTGEVFSTQNGDEWRVFDFNEFYNGYYPRTTFSCISATPNNSVAIVGTDPSGRSVMYVSSQGTVWSERELSYLVSGTPRMLEESVLGLVYDPLADQYIATCTSGVLFTVPACSHCNAVISVMANELYDLALTEDGNFFVIGSDSFAGVVRR